ncbi:MAG: hypothetical protein Q9228_001449 [Teloschistes exilis]
MDGSQSPTPTLDFPMTLEDAYKEIDVTDHDMSDGDVVVAFHNMYSAKMTAHQLHEIVKPRWTFKALVIIARHRRSKLLEFILTIIPHLTKDNATGLLSRRFGFELEPSEKAFIIIDDDDQASAAETANNQPSPANWPDSLASSQLACGDPNADPVSSSDDGIILTHDAASPYTYTSPSSDDPLLDSDCGEPIGGKYFNGNYWVCQECDEEFSEDKLEDGKCHCGHIICFCDTEAFDPETDVCTCEPSSDDDGESTGDEPGMAWDSVDGVWRCTDCSWEVEADDEYEGYCHCRLAEPAADGYTTVRRIELLPYDDYEPAGSDSSGAEWVDSESDSEDEAFVEDDGPVSSSRILTTPLTDLDIVALISRPPLYEPLNDEGLIVLRFLKKTCMRALLK